MTRRLFTTLHVYHDDAACSAAMNMAIDEALLEFAMVPSIRFYRWQSPALSFGYFGKFAGVSCFERGAGLGPRRACGGDGFHGGGLMLSIVIPVGDSVFGQSLKGVCENLSC